MKKQFLFLIAILFFISCKKENKPVENEAIEPAHLLPTLKNSDAIAKYGEIVRENYRPPGERDISASKIMQYYHVGATTYHSYANAKGLAAETHVLKLRMGPSKIKSFWIAFYYPAIMPDGTTEVHWVQWGYAVHKDWGLMSALYVFSITKGGYAPIDVRFINDHADLKYDSKNKVRFEIVNITGTTWWQFKRNGLVITEVDLRTQTASTSQVMTESNGAPDFGTVLNVSYYQVMNGDTWENVPNGYSTASNEWNIQGRNQISTFNLSQFTMGGTPKSFDSILW